MFDVFILERKQSKYRFKNTTLLFVVYCKCTVQIDHKSFSLAILLFSIARITYLTRKRKSWHNTAYYCILYYLLHTILLIVYILLFIILHIIVYYTTYCILLIIHSTTYLLPRCYVFILNNVEITAMISECILRVVTISIYT